jgi:hypothetical protein
MFKPKQLAMVGPFLAMRNERSVVPRVGEAGFEAKELIVSIV